MSLRPKYSPASKDRIIAALQVMIDNLRRDLLITEKVSSDLDTEEEHRNINELCELPPVSAEELRQSVESAKDESISKLGHIQKRIDEVRALKEAFESSDIPSRMICSKAYWALRSSLLFEAMHLGVGNPTKEIFGKGIASLGLSKEKVEDIERLGRTIEVYTEALWFGFHLSPHSWGEFPFDDL